MADDLKVRTEATKPSGPEQRHTDRKALVLRSVIALVVVVVLLLVWWVKWGQTSFHNWQATQYLKAHGVVAAPLAQVPAPISGLATDAHGNVYALSNPQRLLTVLHPDGTRTLIHIPSARAFGTTFSGTLQGSGTSHAIVTQPDGTTFIADEYRDAIIRVAPNGTVDMNWVRRLKNNMYEAAYLYGDAHGNLYQLSGYSITRIDSQRNITYNWASLRPLQSAWLAVSPQGEVLVVGTDKTTATGDVGVYQVAPGKAPKLLTTYSHAKYGRGSLTSPPFLQLMGAGLAFSPSESLWALEVGAIATLKPSGDFVSWWLATPQKTYSTAATPFAIAANGTAYGTITPNAALAPSNNGSTKPSLLKLKSTIVHFELPKKP